MQVNFFCSARKGDEYYLWFVQNGQYIFCSFWPHLLIMTSFLSVLFALYQCARELGQCDAFMDTCILIAFFFF